MQQAAAQLTPYAGLLQDLKARIQAARMKAALAVNHELVSLYSEVGREILTRQRREGWGAKIIERLARDLRRAFPEMNGFSPRNLKYMRAFAEAYEGFAKVQQLAAQIPWFHNCVILDRLKQDSDREFYIRKTIENGWSRSVLEHQISLKLHRRQGKAVTNFKTTLPKRDSDLAHQLLKDPYSLEFLGMAEGIAERELEASLVGRIREFLLELGAGFAFVGQQVPIRIGDEDYRLDLLFYHLRLRCYVVVDLKIEAFKPEFAGKMGFYLSAVDDLLRHEDDKPTVGLILCQTKNKIVAEYALRDSKRPMSAATYRLLPKGYRRSLPTAEEIEIRIKD